MRILLVLALAPVLAGCIVKDVAETAVEVVSIPVKAASAGVDAATTSQSEADERRGREIRKQEEERGRQLRLLEKRCRKDRPLPTDDCTSFRSR
ncbi:MAG TPA: hypothetical protein VJM15_01305 [Sphingomicrobium sp.]|nr:hypothetical protein [Sphingomicrobium sp.]